MKLPSSSATDLNKPYLQHFLTTQDYSKEQLIEILDLIKLLKDARRDNAVPQLFKGKSLAMIFEQPSTRTRISFEVAATILGGHALFLSERDIHLGAKENMEDTSRVISRMCDIILARVNSHKTVAELAQFSTVPVINGLSDWVHPTQIMADLFTMQEHMPDGKKLEDLTITFMGDSTNMCSSLSFACTKFGMNFKHIGPRKYLSPASWQTIAKQNCALSGGTYIATEDTDAVEGSDFVIADSFYWFGQEDEKEARLKAFMPHYVVTEEIMEKAGANALFMHCLPANDQRETTREVMESSRSIIFDEAENRLSAEMAILVYFTHKNFFAPKNENVHHEKIDQFLKSI